MSDTTLWWLLAGTAVILELISGTFYLLMISLGLGAGAVAAYLGASTNTQMLSAAVVGSGAVLVWHLLRSKRGPEPALEANPDLNIDIGSTVHVAQTSDWREDGSVTVRHRGADWAGQLAEGSSAQAGTYAIVQVRGSVLVLRKV